MLNLDALLQDKPEGKVIPIGLQDAELFANSLGILYFRIPPVKIRRKLYEKYHKPMVPLNRIVSPEDIVLQLQSDDFGYALEMLQFVEDWKGFDGPFDRKKLTAFFEQFERVALSFALGLEKVLGQFEKDLLLRQELLEKNS